LPQITERILARVLAATSDVHVRLLLAQSYARQRKSEAAVAEFKSVGGSAGPGSVMCVRALSCRIRKSPFGPLLVVPQVIDTTESEEDRKTASSGISQVLMTSRG
jgi:hypothetical protein